VTFYSGESIVSDLFQLPVETQQSVGTSGFAKFELTENPFPAAGIDSGAFYKDHMVDELRRVNEWLREVGNATSNPDPGKSAVRPLALFGSLGVGKTHLLRYLERGLDQNVKSPVLRKGLAEEGMTRIVLANLMLRYLPTATAPELDDEPGVELLRAIIQYAQTNDGGAERLLQVVAGGSPIQAPLHRLLRSKPSDDYDPVTWFSRWMRREYTTPTQRMKLNLSGGIESEGQALRAVADILRVARAAGLLQVWFLMIDQLEELWREGVVTPSRRARFLTDLRTFIDQALEGAPVAVLLAWNTTVTQVGTDVGLHISNDYQALWQRLGQPIDIPQLQRKDIWPFAEEYLRAADVRSSSSAGRLSFYRLLKDQTNSVISELDEKSNSSAYAPRAVLDAWRRRAETTANPGR
jgi:hypothetical protein